MWTKKITSILPVLSLSMLLVATGCDRDVVGPDLETKGSFTITSQLIAVSDTVMNGTFVAKGSIDDRGSVVEVLDPGGPLHQRGSIHGKKIMTTENGTITMEFYATLFRVDGITLRAIGGFKVAEGTGRYGKLQGSGEIDMEVSSSASPSAVTKRLEGVATYDQ